MRTHLNTQDYQKIISLEVYVHSCMPCPRISILEEEEESFKKAHINLIVTCYNFISYALIDETIEMKHIFEERVSIREDAVYSTAVVKLSRVQGLVCFDIGHTRD